MRVHGDLKRLRSQRLLSAVAVAAATVVVALIDLDSALWLSAPLILLWLLVSGLTRPVERLIERLRGGFDPPVARSRNLVAPSLPWVAALHSRVATLATAVRPPPAWPLPGLLG